MSYEVIAFVAFVVAVSAYFFLRACSVGVKKMKRAFWSLPTDFGPDEVVEGELSATYVKAKAKLAVFVEDQMAAHKARSLIKAQAKVEKAKAQAAAPRINSRLAYELYKEQVRGESAKAAAKANLN